jgi:uncharacterized protein
MSDIAFEWDDGKDASNRTKHGVSFAQAIHVFSDPHALEFADDRRDYGEDRRIIIGRCGDSLIILVVAYTDREDVIRIISARPASAQQSRRYWQGL